MAMQCGLEERCSFCQPCNQFKQQPAFFWFSTLSRPAQGGRHTLRTQRNAEDDSVNSAVLSALRVSAMRTITARKRSRSLVSMLGGESCNSVHSSEFLSEESFSYFGEPVRDVADVELQVRLQLACVAHVLFVEQALHGYCGGFS